jgi:hypothetical protein
MPRFKRRSSLKSVVLVGADPRVCPDLGGHTGPPLQELAGDGESPGTIPGN